MVKFALKIMDFAGELSRRADCVAILRAAVQQPLAQPAAVDREDERDRCGELAPCSLLLAPCCFPIEST